MRDNPLMKLVLFSSVHVELLIFFPKSLIFFSDSELWYFLFDGPANQWPWCLCEP